VSLSLVPDCKRKATGRVCYWGPISNYTAWKLGKVKRGIRENGDKAAVVSGRNV
jgi:hypothetical protein